MSRKLKRVLHAVEEKQAGVWRVIICDHDKRRLLKHCAAKADRRMVVYVRDEQTLRPGRCLWVVESRISEVLPWRVSSCQSTLLGARTVIRELKRRLAAPLLQARLLRFVLRKERAW